MDFADKKFLAYESDYLRRAPEMAARPKPAHHLSVESVGRKLRAPARGLGESWRRAVLQACAGLAMFSAVLVGMQPTQASVQPAGAQTAHLQSTSTAPAANS